MNTPVERLRYAITLGIIFLTLVLTHEYTHIYIAETHGCDAKLHPYPQFHGDGWTSASFMSVSHDCSNLTAGERMIHQQAQNTVDTAGYQIITAAMFLSALLLLVLYELREVKQNLAENQHRSGQNG